MEPLAKQKRTSVLRFATSGKRGVWLRILVLSSEVSGRMHGHSVVVCVYLDLLMHCVDICLGLFVGLCCGISCVISCAQPSVHHGYSDACAGTII